MTRLATAWRTLLLAALVPALPGASLALDFCHASARAALDGCIAGAESDRQLALAKCANQSRFAARKACGQQAAADAKDALAGCVDQDAGRQTACARLGPAPYDPAIDPADFVATIDNPYFPLAPGTTFVYEGATAEGFERDEFFVSHNTRVIQGVTCVEVHDTVTLDGELIEDTLDWFAQDRAGNVWYFGENSKQLAGGLIVGVEGSWTAGVDGARPGIAMKAHSAVGDFYRQEFSLATAEDLAEVIRLDGLAQVPFGSFAGCLETRETTALDAGDVARKLYAAGVGNVLTIEANGERSALVQIKKE